MRLVLCSLLAALCWAQAETCAIEGQVLNNATGAPIRKVQVQLSSALGSGSPRYGGSTDASGRFALADITPGEYVLSAERAGFVRATFSRYGAGRRGSILRLAAGQHLNDVVFRLTPHGVIIGRVLDEDGDAVAGAQVQALRNGYVQGRRTLQPAGSAMTNDIGDYRIAGLAPGKYFFTASYGSGGILVGGKTEEGYAPVYYPGTNDPASAAAVQVAAASEMRIDLSLTKTRTVRVSGRVASPGGVGAIPRNVMVFLMPLGGGVRGSTSNSTVAQDGKFELRRVVPGAYLAVAHWYEDGKRLIGSQQVDVGNAGLDGINVTISAAFEVRGHLKVEGGAALGEHGTQVFLQPVNEMLFGGSVSGRVQSDGSFALANVAPERYRVQVAGLPEGCYAKSARLGEYDMLENGGGVTSAAGTIEIIVSPSGGRVDGTVSDGGQPDAGATVVLVPGEARSHRSDLFRTAVSDGGGRFSIKGIAPGDYKLYAWQDTPEGAWQDPDFLKRYENGAEAVSVEENGRHAVQLKLLPGEAP